VYSQAAEAALADIDAKWTTGGTVVIQWHWSLLLCLPLVVLVGHRY
jgi:hypothetical protein